MNTYDSLIRVSKMAGRVESAESTMTIVDQRESNEYAIRARGGRVGIELKALDASGRTITESPQWRKALARVQAGESNGFAVAYGDRLSRNWRALGGFLDALESAGGEVIIAGMPNVDYRTDDGRAHTGMMAVMSDMQWSAASTRNKRIAAAALARGVPNRVPYGYMRNGTFVNKVLVSKVDPELDGKALVPDPERARFVRTIFQMRVDRCSWTQIASALESLGAPPPTSKGGARWVAATISTIVRNRAYLGFVTLGDREPVLAHEPLVDQATWREAQSTQRVTRNGSMTGSLARGLVHCASCGGVMSVMGATGHGSVRRVLYTCRRGTARGACVRPLSIMRDGVDKWLDEWMVDGIESEEPFAIFATARELSDAHATLRTAIAQRKQIVTTAATWDPDDARVAYDNAVLRESIAQAHYDDLLARSEDAASLPESADAWSALALDDKRRVLRLVIERIEVSPPLTRSRYADITDRLTLLARGA